MSQRKNTTTGKLAWQLELTVAWICVLEKEYFAAEKMLDEEYGTARELSIASGKNDSNVYVLGRIGDHKVVIYCPCGVKGQMQAYRIITDMRSTFHSIRVALIVGLGGGAPSVGKRKENDVRLGDVVVSKEVVMYMSGTQTDEGFETNPTRIKPPQILLSAATRLEGKFINKESLQDLVCRATASLPRKTDYARPRLDQLFKSNVTCDGDCACKGELLAASSKLVERASRPPHAMIKMHKGVVGSADVVLKSARVRDKLAALLKIVCFEMEAGMV